LINEHTKEINYKIHDREAEFGFVTHLKVSDQLLAVGYSSGTILVFDLESRVPDEEDKDKIVFERVHKF
jgi:hypothetical protein